MLRKIELKVEVIAPAADQVHQLTNRSVLNYIYIGEPFRSDFRQSYIQWDDDFARLEDIPAYVLSGCGSDMMTTALKVDKQTKMGIVTDVQQEWAKLGAGKVIYATSLKVD